MITFDDVKFYHSKKVNFYDANNNGGSINTDALIVSGDLNNIFNETTATERENGAIKRAKIFIKNLTLDRKMSSTFLGVTKDADYPDAIVLYDANRKPHYTFTFDEDVPAGTSAGTEIAFRDPTPDGVDVSDFVNRVFRVGSQELTVDSVDADNNKIKFKEDTTEDIQQGDLAYTADDDEIYESDEDFSSKQKYVNTLIVQTLNDGDGACYVGANDAQYFSEGQAILVVDNYRRPLFRTHIKSIEDGTDSSNKKIVFEKEYNGITLPSNTGYLCAAIEFDLEPGSYKPFWLELQIGASNALSAETTSSFQLGITFDDISAG